MLTTLISTAVIAASHTGATLTTQATPVTIPQAKALILKTWEPAFPVRFQWAKHARGGVLIHYGTLVEVDGLTPKPETGWMYATDYVHRNATGRLIDRMGTGTMTLPYPKVSHAH
jgi:hypothetical protein